MKVSKNAWNANKEGSVLEKICIADCESIYIEHDGETYEIENKNNELRLIKFDYSNEGLIVIPIISNAISFR